MHPAPPSAQALPPSSDPRWVVVSNLPREANDAWLRVFFATIGSVEFVDFLGTEGPGSASVLFATVDQATAALRYDGYPALGIVLQVQTRNDATTRSISSSMSSLLPSSQSQLPFQPRSRPLLGHQQESKPTHKNLYVLNLPLDATTDQLTALFASYGTVVHCVILAMLDAQARRRGFIDMSSPFEAKEAIEGLNGFVWHGYPIEVSYAIVQRSGGPFDQESGRNIIKRNVPRNRFNTGPRRVPSDSTIGPRAFPGAGLLPPPLYRDMGGSGQSGPSSPAMSEGSSLDESTATDPCTIFISGLDPVAILDDDDFRHALEPYGAVTAASLSRDQEGISRGFGVVTFSAEAEASAARDHLDGKLVNGRRLTSHNLVYNRTRHTASGLATGSQVTINLAQAAGLQQALTPSSFGRPSPLASSLPFPTSPVSSSIHSSAAHFNHPSPLLSPQYSMPHGRLGSQYTSHQPSSWATSISPPFQPASSTRRHDQIPMGAIGSSFVNSPREPLLPMGTSAYRSANLPTATWFRSNSTPRPVEIKPDPREAAAHKHNDGEEKSPSPRSKALLKQLAAPFTPKVALQANGVVGSPSLSESNDASPASTRSTGTSVTFSPLETPDVSCKSDQGAAIWGSGGTSTAFGNSSCPWSASSSAIRDGHSFNHLSKHAEEGNGKHFPSISASGSALLALQEDAPPYHFGEFGEKRRAPLAPVGHEKTSSPHKNK